jgi:hypothetical protein
MKQLIGGGGGTPGPAGSVSAAGSGTAAAPGIAFSADPNTGIYSPGADQLAISTNGTGRLRIDASGRILAGAEIGIYAGASVLYPTSNGVIDLNSNVANIPAVLKLGNTGFSNTPSYSTGAIEFRGFDSVGNTIGYSSIEGLISDATAATRKGDIVFKTINASTITERVRIDSSGRLLVGTSSTSSGYRALVQGNTLGTGDTFGWLNVSRGDDSPTSGAFLGAVTFNSSTHGTAGGVIAAFRDGGTWSGSSKPTGLLFNTTPDGSLLPLERMRIDSAGRVGIGTSSPARELHVSGTASTFARINSPSAAFPVLELTENNSTTAGQYWQIFKAPTTHLLEFYNGATRLTLDSQGRVGIGTTSPGSYNALADDLVINSAGDTGITINSGTSNYGSVYFADGISGADAYRGFIEYNHINDSISFGAAGATRARIDSSGRLLVGTTASRSNAFGQANIQLESASPLQSITHNGANQFGSAYVFAKTRGTAFETLTNNDNLGILSWQGSNGTALNEGARIQADVDGAVSGGGANDLPTRLTFSTTADGFGSPTERMRITSDGYVRLTSSSGGIQFNGDTAAANALDDYEEGTWTPVLRGSGTAGTYELSRATGIYTKIGRTVLTTMSIQLAGSITGGGTGYAQITGLPFTQAANSYPSAICGTYGVDISTNYTSIMFLPITQSATTTWYLQEIGDNVSPGDLPIAAFSANDQVIVTVTYIV